MRGKGGSTVTHRTVGDRNSDASWGPGCSTPPLTAISTRGNIEIADTAIIAIPNPPEKTVTQPIQISVPTLKEVVWHMKSKA